MEIQRRTVKQPWTLEDGRGNHRVLLNVKNASSYVRAQIKWRRRDLNPENTAIMILHNQTETKIDNIITLDITRESGEIVFEAPLAGEYSLYYLPFQQTSKNSWFPIIEYSKGWMASSSEDWVKNLPASFEEAEVICIESRTEFDSFYPMEVVATKLETEQVLYDNANKPWIAYTEDRKYPIRMLTEIPFCWIEKGTSTSFDGVAQPNEYYVFQIAIWARQDLHGVDVEFKLNDNSLITKEQLTCFQTSGTDWLGNDFTKTVDIKSGVIQPFWIGVDLPKDTTGKLDFEVIILTDAGEQPITVSLDVQGDNIPNRGDHDLWRLSRLRWLNSTIGLDNETTQPYSQMEMGSDGHMVSCHGKKIKLSEIGLPLEIISLFDGNAYLSNQETAILSKPIEFNVYENGEKVSYSNIDYKADLLGTGSAVVTTQASSKNLVTTNESTIEYDGHIDTLLTITAAEDVCIDDMRLSYTMSPECSKYMMGMGYEGGAAPDEWNYKWEKTRTNNFVWIGDTCGGFNIKLKHTKDIWELYTYEVIGLPEGWHNDGLGGCDIKRDDNGMNFVAYTGTMKLKKGQSVTLRYSILITPLKSMNSDAHWTERYEHPTEKLLDLESSKAGGATVVNLHQGERYNRYINYPFCEDKELTAEIKTAHDMGLKYKLYYTVRELTTHAAEFWVIRSLGDEVLMNGPSFRVAEHFVDEFFNQDKSNPSTGGPWICEHLVEGCIPAWQTVFKNKDYDCSVATVGLSRWHNYYLEGLRWAVQEIDCDGIYLDGVGYDRQIMKRVRKVMNSNKEGCLIDLHSGNNFHPAYGLCNVLGEYMELLPSTDSLWIGEAFDYETTTPEYWLVEVSGIPLGLMGDMLHRGGNKWRGMVFGMTPRCNYPEGGSPLPIWNLWGEFGMVGCVMKGWWSSDCPISVSNDNVKATAYVKGDKVLISVASWDSEPVDVTLDIDFSKLPFGEAGTTFTMPEIEDFQDAEDYQNGQPIHIDPAKGKIIILNNK